MTRQIAEREAQSRYHAAVHTGRPQQPPFKPVALPAVAAALHAAGLRPGQPTKPEQRKLPAILRQDAATDE